jgi:putative nucleotidyltransferase with HDIG domain
VVGNPHRALLGKLERVDREGGRAPRIAIDDEFRLGADDLGACAWVVSSRKQQVPCARVFPARNRQVQCRVLGDPRANQVPETTTSRRGDPRDMGVSLSHASPPSGSQEGLPLYTPVVALIAYGYARYSFWVAATFFIPAIALQRLLQLYQEQRDATRALGETNARLERANLSFAAALVATLDARDQYTAGHSAAVAVYARDIAKHLGLSLADQQLAHLCGLVHDIGKVGLPPGLLEKQGPLSLHERRQMEDHPAIGQTILEKVDDYASIATIVRHHHERVDGNGYPDGLVGAEIPLISRILAVADAYDAMTSDRPYRDAMPSQVARIRLAQAVEGQFDIAVVAAFEAILASSDTRYKRAASLERPRAVAGEDLERYVASVG